MSAQVRPLRLHDVSSRRRFGCKGPAAESWLATRGFSVERGVNRWAIDARGVLVARLATSEFLVEAQRDASGPVEGARSRLSELPREPGVYPVAREDFAIDAAGPTLPQFLLQTCSIDFAPILRDCAPDRGEVLLTSMIGVGVVAIVRREEDGPHITLWSDPSYAHYFWTTLLEVAADLDGGVAAGNAQHDSEEQS